VFYNILLTVPFGFGVHYVFEEIGKRIIVSGILLGVFIESIQLVISIKIQYPYRLVDINDVFLNFVGVLVGYLLFRLFSRLVVLFVEKFDFTDILLLSYLYRVSKRSTKQN